jgi:hypothetical protein
MRDIVFLFGAGASYGAGGILPERPPVGAQLFSALRRFFPGSWGSLPAELSLAFEQNFEVGMQVVYNDHGAAIPQLMRDMAIYFIQFRPYEKFSLYSRLIEDLLLLRKLDRTILSTLNYECILEFALAGMGVEIQYFSDRTSSTCPVWKLHGSSNFFSADLHFSQDVSYGTGVVIEGGVRAFLDIGEVIGHCLAGTGLAPVMSLYMEGKPVGVCPSMIKQIQGFWKNAVESARMLFLIGVHPNIADAHIWEPLAHATGHIAVIGDQSALMTWAKSYRTGGGVEFLGARFLEGYPRLLERLEST